MGALTLAILLCDTEFDKLQTGMMLAKKILEHQRTDSERGGDGDGEN